MHLLVRGRLLRRKLDAVGQQQGSQKTYEEAAECTH